MSNIGATVAEALVLRRTYPTTRERLFALWTDAASYPRWFGPGDTTIAEATIDARPGGQYRIAMRSADGEAFTVIGEYRDVRPPERLVFTWTWDDADPGDTTNSLVTIELFERGPASTELVLTHEKLANVESRARHEHGWSLILDQIERGLA